VVVHADVSRRTSGPKGALSSVVYGSATAPPPVAAFQLGRDGVVWLVASGVGNNAGHGNARAIGHPDWNTNAHTIGIEAANDNGLVKPAEPWNAVQMEAYRRLVVACHKWMAKENGVPLATQIRFTVGHKEWSTTGKSDPSFNMDTFRAQTRALAFPPPPEPPKEPAVPQPKYDTFKDWYGDWFGPVQSLIHWWTKTRPVEQTANTARDQKLADLRDDVDAVSTNLEALEARVAALEPTPSDPGGTQ
jgi:hypothetical protein